MAGSATRAFQLRAPCRRACVSFYAATSSGYVSGLDKFVGIRYVEAWTDADAKARNPKPETLNPKP